MTEVNIPLLRKAVEWVEEQAKLPKIDREWDQNYWVALPTDVAAHLAEEVVLESLPGPSKLKFNDIQWALSAHCGTTYCVAGYVAMCDDPRYANDSEVDGIPAKHKAEELLGLDFTQANKLFHYGNTAEDVRRIAEQIAGERL